MGKQGQSRTKNRNKVLGKVGKHAKGSSGKYVKGSKGLYSRGNKIT